MPLARSLVDDVELANVRPPLDEGVPKALCGADEGLLVRARRAELLLPAHHLDEHGVVDRLVQHELAVPRRHHRVALERVEERRRALRLLEANVARGPRPAAAVRGRRPLRDRDLGRPVCILGHGAQGLGDGGLTDAVLDAAHVAAAETHQVGGERACLVGEDVRDLPELVEQ